MLPKHIHFRSMYSGQMVHIWRYRKDGCVGRQQKFSPIETDAKNFPRWVDWKCSSVYENWKHRRTTILDWRLRIYANRVHDEDMLRNRTAQNLYAFVLGATCVRNEKANWMCSWNAETKVWSTKVRSKEKIVRVVRSCFIMHKKCIDWHEYNDHYTEKTVYGFRTLEDDVDSTERHKGRRKRDELIIYCDKN